MRTSRPIGGTVLLMCIMLLGPGPSAFAASVTHDTDNTSRLQDTLHQKNITIPWEHPPSLDGETYHFVYKNRVVFNVSPERYLAPIVKVDVKVEMTDSFRLTGNGLYMHVSFDWSWEYTVTDQEGITLTLDPLADFPVMPFVFATADGVNPAPGVTNWQQLSTQGDPFHCDPL